MTNLSDLIPAGGGQNNTDFVADGAIASGKPVILTAAGKAAEVDETSTSVSDDYLAGSEVGGTAGASNEGAQAAWDSSDTDKYVYVFSDVADSKKLKAYVATVSGSGGSTSISLGTVVIIDSAACYVQGIAADPNTAGRFLVSWADEDDSYHGYMAAITINGTSLDVGTDAKFTSTVLHAQNRCQQLVADPNVANQFLHVHRINDTNDNCEAIVATISGTGTDATVSYGTAASFTGTDSADIPRLAADPSTSGLFVAAWKDKDNSDYGTAKAITLSGTTITGTHTEAVFQSANPVTYSVVFNPDTAKQFLVFFGGYKTGYSDRQFQGRVGAVSGSNTLSFEAVVAAGNNGENAGGCGLCSMGMGSGKFLASYNITNGTDSNKILQSIGSISGTTLTWATRNATISSIEPYETGKGLTVARDTNNAGRAVTAYNNYTPSPYERSFITEVGGTYTSSNLTATNLLGIAAGAISDTATGTINTWGSRNEVQSSLTIASDYYVQEDGTITTTSTSPAQLIGQAISATQINIKDYTG